MSAEQLRAKLRRVQAMLGRPETDAEAALERLVAESESAATQRDELREKLAEVEFSRDQYVDLFDNAPAPYIAFDRGGNIRHANRRACEVFGCSPRMLHDLSVGCFLASGNRRPWRDHLNACCENGSAHPVVSTLSLETREWQKPVQLITPGDPAFQRPDLFLTLVHDLSERDRFQRLVSENELFHELTETIEEVFWLFDWQQWRMLYVSPAYKRIWQRSAEALYQHPRDWEQAIHPDDHEAVRRRFYKQAGEEQWEHRYRIIRPDGEVRSIVSRNFPLRDQEGVMYRMASVTQDVTERENAEHQLEQREQELARVGRLGLMGEMASGVAHELNQPLAAISTYAQGFESWAGEHEELPGWIQQAIEQISKQSQRAGRIIHSLRKFAKMEEPERDFADTGELVREVVELTHADLQRHQAEVELDLPDDLPPLFVGAIEIEQVLVNLLHNAAHAMDEADTPKRRITIRAAKADDEQVQLTVADTGPGVSDAMLERIFEPFYTSKDSGLGIGLNICETIIAHHGGRIWAKRNEAGGLTFHLLLPTDHAAESPPPPNKNRTGIGALSYRTTRPLKPFDRSRPPPPRPSQSIRIDW